MTVRILTGDCLARMDDLDAASVHCLVTSPPYYAPDYAAIADRRLRAGLAQVAGLPTDCGDDLPLFAGEAA